NLQACLLEALDDLIYMCGMFEFVFRVDQDIIEIGCNEIIEKIEKNIINILLKYNWTINQAKRKNFIFINTILSLKRYQFLRVWINLYLIKCLVNIKFYKDLSLS